MAETSISQLMGFEVLGLGTMLQVVPFECWISVRRPSRSPVFPTAQMSVGDTTASWLRLVFVSLTLGVGTTAQVGSHAAATAPRGAAAADAPTSTTAMNTADRRETSERDMAPLSLRSVPGDGSTVVPRDRFASMGH